MTDTAQDVLRAFDTLSPTEQQEVVAEILRRTAPSGELPDEALHELADELFQSYDAEEEGRAQR